jgi:hypothetical protein
MRWSLQEDEHAIDKVAVSMVGRQVARGDLKCAVHQTGCSAVVHATVLVLGIGAPSTTAFVLAALSAGREGVRGLWRGGRRWRVGARWYAAVLVIPGLAWAPPGR